MGSLEVKKGWLERADMMLESRSMESDGVDGTDNRFKRLCTE